MITPEEREDIRQAYRDGFPAHIIKKAYGLTTKELHLLCKQLDYEHFQKKQEMQNTCSEWDHIASRLGRQLAIVSDGKSLPIEMVNDKYFPERFAMEWEQARRAVKQ